MQITYSDGSVKEIKGNRNYGGNGIVPHILDEERVVEVEVYIDGSGAIGQMDYIPCDIDAYHDWVRTYEMPDCPSVNLDFNDEELIKPGDYITDQLQDKYSVQIQVKANEARRMLAYAPDGAGTSRVFLPFPAISLKDNNFQYLTLYFVFCCCLIPIFFSPRSYL